MSRETWNAVTPVEYGEGERKKTRWVRVGAAWQREDGGFSIVLDALPVNGKVMVMPRKDDDRSGGGGGGF